MKELSAQVIVEFILSIIFVIACLVAFIIYYVNKSERERDDYYHHSFKNKQNED